MSSRYESASASMSARYESTDAEDEESLVGSNNAVQQEEIKLQIEDNNKINAEAENQQQEENKVQTPESDLEVTRCMIYKVAAEGHIDWLKSHNDQSEIETFETRGEKNTILHIYIIAQSSKLRKKSFRFSLEYMCEKVMQIFCNATAKPLSVSETAEKILSSYPSLLCKANKAGDSPLHMAARHGNTEIADALINHVAGKDNVHKMLHLTNEDRETALHEAVRYQHEDLLKLLIYHDNPEFKYSANKSGETPLYMAAERGNVNLTAEIAKYYISPASKGPNGRTALHAAALHCDPSEYYYETLMKQLGKMLEDTEKEEKRETLTKITDDQGRTPLHYNEGLLSLDTSAAFVADNDGKTALHIAASKGNEKSVEEFIKKCPECFELVDNNGRNALHYAVESNNQKVVDAILRSEYLGDLVKKKDNNGVTPLHLLAMYRINLPNLIKDPRFDKLAFDNDQHTPLDIILSNSTPSENNLDNHMQKAGIDQGKRVAIQQRSNNVEKVENGTGNKQDIHRKTDVEKVENGTGDNLDSHRKTDIDEELKEARQNHLVVVALLATITFAAGFTLPGGYIQDDGPHLGYAVFTKRTAFQAFVITDTLAMVISFAAVLIHLLIAIHKEKIIWTNARKEKMIAMDKGKEITTMMKAMNERKKMVSYLFNKALRLTLIAIVAMVLAFITGTYAVLSIYPPLAISSTVTGCFFFGLFFYLWEDLLKASKSVLIKVIRVVSWGTCYIVVLIILIPFIFCAWLVCCIEWRRQRKDVAKNEEEATDTKQPK